MDRVILSKPKQDETPNTTNVSAILIECSLSNAVEAVNCSLDLQASSKLALTKKIVEKGTRRDMIATDRGQILEIQLLRSKR